MSDEAAIPLSDPRVSRVLDALSGRSIVLVGMMGSGKSSVGKRLAARLGLPFRDADIEIEAAAGMSIPEIFATRGEPEFRAGEVRVIARLMEGPQAVIATGGGAFMNPVTRGNIAARGVSVWFKAAPELLMRRVRKRNNRPLLRTEDPEATLRHLLVEREPTYALADIAVESRDVPQDAMVETVIDALNDRLGSARRIVPVALAGRAYDIVIGAGLLAEAGPRLARLRPGASVAIVADERVDALHGPALRASLDHAGLSHATIRVAPGEGTKSWAGLKQVVEGLLEARVERRDLVVALGGGVVGDLVGFAAGIARRGIDFVQVPTTLLAQVDSSVGGKTGINTRQGKNLVGLFHQPILVLADTRVLDTLPPRDFRAGYAELVKYGLLGDRALFDWLEEKRAEIFAGGPARIEAIAAACRAKAAIVARDEKETGDRALLNLGHTFGHALEAATGYSDRLVHGEAVAIGMAQAFRFSARLGLIDAATAARVEAHLSLAGLPTRPAAIPGGVGTPAKLLAAICQDKKVERGRLTFILARGIGEAFIEKGVDPVAVEAFLADDLALEAAA